MAELTITAANVKLATQKNNVQVYLAGEDIDAGEVAYLDTSANNYKLAQCDGTAVEAGASVFALTNAASGQYFIGVSDGLVTIGGTMTLGVVYAVAPTPGKLIPSDELTTGQYITPLAIPSTTAIARLKFDVTGLVA